MYNLESSLPLEFLTHELERYKLNKNKNLEQSQTMTDRDKKLISYYRFFIRKKILMDKRNDILDDNILKSLIDYLIVTPKMSYESFKLIAMICSDHAKKYFTPKVFLMFPQDENHCINTNDFISYLERSIDIEHTMLNLMNAIPITCDPHITFIDENQLEIYIHKMIEQIDVNQQMSEEFYEYYIITSTQKFLFFLDSRKTNIIFIKTLAHSSVMEELLELCKFFQNGEIDIIKQSKIASNWFSCENALFLYQIFVNLDKDQSGCLSINEILSFIGVSGKHPINFTLLAYKHLYDAYVIYESKEMDYKCFITFVLAIENPTSLQSIKYFWRILDYDNSGILTPVKIRYFYQAIHSSLVDRYDAPSVDHLIVEIFDMIGCNSLEGITLNDLLKSKQGHIVISILLDSDGFWRYDNREHLAQSDNFDDYNDNTDELLENNLIIYENDPFEEEYDRFSKEIDKMNNIC